MIGEVIFEFLLTSGEMISGVLYTHGFFDLLNGVISQHLYSRAIPDARFNFIPYTEVEILGGYSSGKKKQKSCFRYIKNQAE